MKNRCGTTILTNLTGVHPRNIHTKYEAYLCNGFGEEVKNVKSLRRRMQTDRYSHTLYRV